MAADLSLAGLRADACRRAPNPPGPDQLIEDAGRQRLAAYYLYGAQLAGLIGGDDDLPPARWPPELAGRMQQLGLARYAPRTGRGLDAQLTPAQQGTRRSPDRQLEFARLLVDLINQGTFGPLCAEADRVRLAEPVPGGELSLELIKDRRVVRTCPVRDHWELVAQHLAGAPLRISLAEAGSAPASEGRLARQLKEHGIAEVVSRATTLAVGIHPLGAAAGLGTRLVRARLRAGHDQADALRRLSQDLATLRAQADAELHDLPALGDLIAASAARAAVAALQHKIDVSFGHTQLPKRHIHGQVGPGGLPCASRRPSGRGTGVRERAPVGPGGLACASHRKAGFYRIACRPVAR
jgi:hypothetical protein